MCNVGTETSPEIEPRLSRDIHNLATHYHWSPDAIKDLPTQDRINFIELIREQQERESGNSPEGL